MTLGLQGSTGDLNLQLKEPMAVEIVTILRAMAQFGKGIAFLPNFTVRDAIDHGKLRSSLPDNTSRPYPVFLT